MAEEKQDGQKTIVAFIVGLLIGGMLVWAFSGPEKNAPKAVTEDEATEASDVVKARKASDTETNDAMEATLPELKVGDGNVSVVDQPASASIKMESAIYPVSEGWIGVRDYQNEQLGMILGVVRFSESQGLVPDEITLLRSTVPGKDYAVVIYTEDGDFEFNLAGDVQIDEIFSTFTAE